MSEPSIRAPDWPPCHRCWKPSKPSEQVRHEGNVYCSAYCAPAEAIELAQSTLRRQVLERDGGVCSYRGCARANMLDLRRELYEMRAAALADDPSRPSRARDSYEVRLHALVREGFPRSELEGTRALWDADHIEARVRGGPTSLSNARTLCRAHHLLVTAELAGERAASRRSFGRGR